MAHCWVSVEAGIFVLSEFKVLLGKQEEEMQLIQLQLRLLLYKKQLMEL